MIGHLALFLALSPAPQVVADVRSPHPDVPPAVRSKKKIQQEEPPPRPTRDELRRDWYEWDVEFAPQGDLYRTYLADPRQSKSGTKVQFPVDTAEDNIKIENVLGGHRPLIRWADPAHPETEMELVIEAAVFSRFDINEGWDMDAADYRFGFPFLYRHEDVIIKFHLYHITSHLGDEFISREGAKRDSYHLDEFAVGMSYPYDQPWRVYGEAGISIYNGPETKSGRAQVGAEYIFEPISKRISPYVAVDLQTRNEIEWSWNASAMAGLMLTSKNGLGHGLRGFVEYYRGNDVQTQFKGDREHFLAVGFAADF